ncbi:MAG: DinB family protein [Acetobacterales bacterium]
MEFLSARAVDFDSINVQEDPEGLKLLFSLGPRTTPVVSKGTDYTFGQNTRQVADFLGLNLDHTPLPPEKLVEKLDMVLAATQRMVVQIPVEHKEENVRNRKRTYRVLTHHMPRIAEAFLEAVEEGVFYTPELPTRPPGDDIQSFGQIADYAGQVRRRLADWWKNLDDKSCKWTVETYYGSQAAHDLLERTTWHTAQHVRQIMLSLEGWGIEPDGRITMDDLAGLPMPEKAWDD